MRHDRGKKQTAEKAAPLPRVCLAGIAKSAFLSGASLRTVLAGLRLLRIGGWLLSVLLLTSPSYAERVSLARVPLTEVVRETMAIYFASSNTPQASRTASPSQTGARHQNTKAPRPRVTSTSKSTAKAPDSAYKALIQRASAQSPYRNPAGVFVTLSHAGKSRACWGSVYPQHASIVESTVYATLGALTKEYRYKPIHRTEWPLLKRQVTVVQAVTPISGIQGQNPLQDGLMVRAGGRSGVMLPGEARDAFYQLVQCKLKAGIRPGESYQLYRIVADVYQ